MSKKESPRGRIGEMGQGKETREGGMGHKHKKLSGGGGELNALHILQCIYTVPACLHIYINRGNLVFIQVHNRNSLLESSIYFNIFQALVILYKFMTGTVC